MADNIELSHRKRGPSGESAGLPVHESDAIELTDPWGEKPMDTAPTLSLRDLPVADQRNFALLLVLYFLQGMPVGLAFGSIPFILKSQLSYAQVGVFTLASYPYSLKLLWSPIVDAVYSRRFGRRKSWIIPIQFVSALVLFWLGANIQPYIDDAENKIGVITFLFFVLVFLCATQDIAVDGWALTLLSPPSLSYASTAQTIGLNTGYFLSFTVFLAFNSPDFANRYLRSQPLDIPYVTLQQYLTFAGLAYLITTVLVGLLKAEERTRFSDESVANASATSRWASIVSVYQSMYKVLRLKSIQGLIVVHLVAKFGFQANEAVTNLKLVEKGLSKEDLALTVLIDFPFEIVFGYYAAKWSTGTQSLRPWMLAFLGRLILAFISMLTVAFFPAGGAGPAYFLLIIIVHVLGSFMSTVQFVSINAFHTQVSDPAIGGTYMTTLNTISNLGGQWPRLLIFYGVDWFTQATCSVEDPANPLAVLSCAAEDGKKLCSQLGGTCVTTQDGYYVMNLLCIGTGALLFFTFIRSQMRHLQSLPTNAWRV